MKKTKVSIITVSLMLGGLTFGASQFAIADSGPVDGCPTNSASKPFTERFSNTYSDYLKWNGDPAPTEIKRAEKNANVQKRALKSFQRRAKSLIFAPGKPSKFPRNEQNQQLEPEKASAARIPSAFRPIDRPPRMPE